MSILRRNACGISGIVSAPISIVTSDRKSDDNNFEHNKGYLIKVVLQQLLQWKDVSW